LAWRACDEDASVAPTHMRERGSDDSFFASSWVLRPSVRPSSLPNGNGPSVQTRPSNQHATLVRYTVDAGKHSPTGLGSGSGRAAERQTNLQQGPAQLLSVPVASRAKLKVPLLHGQNLTDGSVRGGGNGTSG
jgi:hypothetical protein